MESECGEVGRGERKRMIGEGREEGEEEGRELMGKRKWKGRMKEDQ